MKLITTLCVAGCLALCVQVASAQPGPLGDHYLSYRVNPVTLGAPVTVADQFIPATDAAVLVFERFLNPVSQDGAGIFDPETHYKWWRVEPNPTIGQTVLVANKFGEADWLVEQLEFLLAPGRKGDTAPPPDNYNHYLCYRAQGPSPDAVVALDDQFLSFTTQVLNPRYLCTPCQKTHNGVVFPIVDPKLHLAVYEVFPPTFVEPLVAFDQFGIHQTFIDTFDPNEYLFVPSLKDVTISVEATTWGRVKSLYLSANR